MSGLLKSQVDMYAFQRLLEKMVSDPKEDDSAEYTCRQAIGYISRSSHSRERTLRRRQF